MVEIVGMSVGGDAADGEVSWTSAAMPVEKRFSRHALGNHHQENLQLFSFLSAATLQGLLPDQAIAVHTPVPDPPDRRIEMRNGAFPVELTILTLGHDRSRIAAVRKIGRDLTTRLQADPTAYPHLEGMQVLVADQRGDRERLQKLKKNDRIIDDMLVALTPELGFVERATAYTTLPDQFAPSDYTRGRVEVRGHSLEVHRSPFGPGLPYATGKAQVTVTLSEAQAQLRKQIAAKDKPTNKTVLITTGAPDALGLVCEFDVHLFELIQQYGAGDDFEPPEHIDTIVLHHWGHENIHFLYLREGCETPFTFGPPAS
ncbi:hypothetical protein [Rhodococcus opacus]|nr:hypothetical protein [Rhodococcus opacus]